MVEAVSTKLVLTEVATLRLLSDNCSERAQSTPVEKDVEDRDSFNIITYTSASRKDLVCGDLLSACRALVRLELPWEEEKAIVAHQVMARMQLD